MIWNNFMHEYGHTIDSRKFGLSYLFAVGIPSIFSANGSNEIKTPPGPTHRSYWTATRANSLAKQYFGKYYGVDWNRRYTPDRWPSNGELRKNDDGSYYYYFYTLEDFYPTNF
jgi:hypothetical protein